ncbi:hypothetical protein GCM10028796_17190 [Ramlibacter monticola]|nr:hypothetical protein [Ramlibacter monticola]
MLQRKKPNRIALFFAHYRVARRYAGPVDAARVALMFAKVA